MNVIIIIVNIISNCTLGNCSKFFTRVRCFCPLLTLITAATFDYYTGGNVTSQVYWLPTCKDGWQRWMASVVSEMQLK